jgi:nucleotide-binding universal stress UspA family protein
MYEKLLVAVDHSKATEHVLSAARDLASLSAGEVWVLHLREREVMGPGRPASARDPLTPYAIQRECSCPGGA